MKRCDTRAAPHSPAITLMSSGEAKKYLWRMAKVSRVHIYRVEIMHQYRNTVMHIIAWQRNMPQYAEWSAKLYFMASNRR